MRQSARAEEILRAAVRVAERLLLYRPWNRAVGEVLAVLGEATGVSRVYVFENHPGPRGELRTSQRYEWAAPGIPPQIANPDLQDFPWIEGGFARWVERMSRGEPVFGLVRDFPPAERAVLEPQEIVSIVAVPIFAEGRWWGFLGFDECRRPRTWSQEEISALMLTSRLLGVAMERQAVEEELEETAGMARRLLEAKSWEALLEAVRPSFQRLLDPDGMHLFVADPSRTFLQHVAEVWEDGACPYRTSVSLDPPEDSCVAWAAHQDAPCFVEDLGDPALPFRRSPEAWEAGVRSVLLIPLAAGGQVTGTLAVDFRSRRELKPSHLRAAELWGRVVAVAVERILEYQAFRDLFERVPVGLYRSTQEGRLLRANRAFAEILGHPSTEALTAWDVRTAYANPRDYRRWQEALRRHGRVEGFEVQWVRADGGRIWVLGSAQVVLGPGGRPAYYEGSVVDITRRKALEEQLAFLWGHDPLTGLLNRRRFREELDRVLAKAGSRVGCAVILLDLDHFQEVNERIGQRAADQVLQAVARLLRESLRAGDLLARVGGDEFGVLLFPVGARQARQAAERLVRRLRGAPLPVEGRGVQISVSCGVAVSGRRAEGETLLAAAEAALHESKLRGGVRLARPAADLKAVDRWEDRLRRALDRGGFLLVGQPIRDLRTGRVDRWELLLRLVEAQEVILPGEFLPAAERTGLVAEMDLWVLRQAVEWLKRFPARLHVNFSARTLAEEGALQQAVRLLRAHPRQARRLVVEITETTVVSDLAQAVRWIRALQQEGCGVALDDFGVGYSSIAHLRSLEVDALKVDGSFVRNLRTDPRDRYLVRAVVEMGHGLRCLVMAECVEDEETLRVVRALGVDCAQGYHLGRPVPFPPAPSLGLGARSFRRRSPAPA
ncbi:MAG: EAL domain-containing protein [Armatimonadota bacterium]|nr:EAL domain-containing protein [Armatimonadota bacterium]MDR7445310.1 EAL domain-containing protein [Armatimonadota bacterium]MDR7569792.1 EAL domain-containing protein [Armatimonadota bacterium]MDR7614045.1 EAL domain-containing protein [Armatimonadota bacterium]